MKTDYEYFTQRDHLSVSCLSKYEDRMNMRPIFRGSAATSIGGELHSRMFKRQDAWTPLPPDQESKLAKMVRALARSDAFDKWIKSENAEFEKSLRGEIELNGVFVPFLIIVDMLIKEEDGSFGLAGDLKTTSTTNLRQFRLSIDKYNYDLQAFVYMEILGIDKFVFFAVNPRGMSLVYTITKGTQVYIDGKRKAEKLTKAFIEEFGQVWKEAK